MKIIRDNKSLEIRIEDDILHCVIKVGDMVTCHKYDFVSIQRIRNALKSMNNICDSIIIDINDIEIYENMIIINNICDTLSVPIKDVHFSDIDNPKISLRAFEFYKTDNETRCVIGMTYNEFERLKREFIDYI